MPALRVQIPQVIGDRRTGRARTGPAASPRSSLTDASGSMLAQVVQNVVTQESPTNKLLKKMTRQQTRPDKATEERRAWLKFRAKVLNNSRQKTYTFTDFMKREKEEKLRQQEEEEFSRKEQDALIKTQQKAWQKPKHETIALRMVEHHEDSEEIRKVGSKARAKMRKQLKKLAMMHYSQQNEKAKRKQQPAKKALEPSPEDLALRALGKATKDTNE